MPERTFFGDAAKARTRETVVAVERQTSAELVVAVRRLSGQYRHADYLFGSLFALAALVVAVFSPFAFPPTTLPLELVFSFVFGALLSWSLPPLRRALVTRRERRAAVDRAARAAFHDLGVSRTRGRTGILAYVSLFEREVVLVPDIGIDPKALEPTWTALQAELTASLRPPRFARFIEALAKLGPGLGAAYPRASDDVNELPDEASEG